APDAQREDPAAGGPVRLPRAGARGPLVPGEPGLARRHRRGPDLTAPSRLSAPATAVPGFGRRDAVSLGVLWLGGFDLRVTLLAVPPVVPLIHRDLGLDEKGISALVGLPVLL